MGFTCHTGDLTWDELISWVQEGERLGYSAFCTTEESGKDAFAVLAVLARETRTISLGTAIVNFYSRTPTLLAMSARSIHDLSGGRFGPFGLGAGGIGFMQRGHGIHIEKPLARAEGNRDPDAVQVATLLMTCVDPDDEAAVFAARRGLAFYCASEHYLHIADICGLGADAREVKVAWEDREFDRATHLVSDRLLEKFCLVGTPQRNAERIRWLFDNGVYPIVYPLPRRERMVEDHHAVLRLASGWAGAVDATPSVG